MELSHDAHASRRTPPVDAIEPDPVASYSVSARPCGTGALISAVTDAAQHDLVVLLAIGLAAAIAGAKSSAAIEPWASLAGTDALVELGVTHGPADETTFRCTYAKLNSDMLDRVMYAWFFPRVRSTGGLLVIAIDGKPIRGARIPHQSTL